MQPVSTIAQQRRRLKYTGFLLDGSHITTHFPLDSLSRAGLAGVLHIHQEPSIGTPEWVGCFIGPAAGVDRNHFHPLYIHDSHRLMARATMLIAQCHGQVSLAG
jgi:hypothetical protein